MATIFSPLGKPLNVSTEDALWLARAVEGEGAPESRVAQTLVNRWAWLMDEQPQTYPHLADLVQAYSQAVNPRWLGDGDLHIKYINEHPKDFAREFAASQRRAENRARNSFTPTTRLAVATALYGPVYIEPGTVHFGEPRDGANQFFRGKGTAAWALYSLAGRRDGPRVQIASILEGGKPHTAIAAVLLGLGGAWVATRGYRRRKR